MRHSKNAQSLIEYVILLGLVASALVGMQVYLKRAVQAKVMDMTDAMLPPGSVDSGVKQLGHVNPVIPLLNTATGQTSSSTLDITNSLTTQNSGSVFVYDANAIGIQESHIASPDPSKDINIQSGPSTPKAGEGG